MICGGSDTATPGILPSPMCPTAPCRQHSTKPITWRRGSRQPSAARPLVFRRKQMMRLALSRLARPWATAVRFSCRDNVNAFRISAYATPDTPCPDLFRVSTPLRPWWPRRRKAWTAGSSPAEGIMGCFAALSHNRIRGTGQLWRWAGHPRLGAPRLRPWMSAERGCPVQVFLSRKASTATRNALRSRHGRPPSRGPSAHGLDPWASTGQRRGWKAWMRRRSGEA